MSRTIHRRGFVKGMAGAGAAALAGSPAFGATGQAQPEQSQPTRRATGLPARGEFLVRNGHVLTMDSALGDIPGGDVHVKSVSESQVSAMDALSEKFETCNEPTTNPKATVN